MSLFFLCYFLSKKRAVRNFWLFIFSLVFYAWGEPLYIVLMIFSAVFDYTNGLLIERFGPRTNKSKAVMIISVIGNMGLMGIFKYMDFIIESINAITGLAIDPVGLALPIGISFYSFQTLSYTIDVYKGDVKAEHSLINFGAYVAMFPQLIAGPIVRYRTVADELANRVENQDEIAKGIRRFIVGLGKKVLLANTMAMVVDTMYNNILDGKLAISSLGMLGSWIFIIAYAMQIYFDFSGYSDMAIGMGLMMGFHYLENFNYPYIASSVTEFWRRWHISLSTFFRDYVYIPMGGNRVPKWRWLFNVMVVWFLTGLWHGASWNFVLWGVYFGVILILEKLFLLKAFKKIPVIGHIFTIVAFLYGWVIFRCEDSLAMIGEMTKALFGGYGIYPIGSPESPLARADVIAFILRDSGVNTVFIIAFVAGIIGCTPAIKKMSEDIQLSKSGRVVRDLALLAVFLLCICELAANSYNPFIYYRF